MTAIIILIARPAVPLLRRWLLLHLAKNASDLGSSFQVSLPPPKLTAFCSFNCFVIDQEREINGEVKSEEMSRTRVVQTKPKIKRKSIQIQSSHLSHAIYVTVSRRANENRSQSHIVDRGPIGWRVSSCRFWNSVENLVTHYEFVRWLAQSQSQPPVRRDEKYSQNSKRGRSSRMRKTKVKKKYIYSIKIPLCVGTISSVVSQQITKVCILFAWCLVKVIIIVDKVRVARLFVLLLTF